MKADNFTIKRNNQKYPVVKASPKGAKPNLTIVTYGSNGEWILENLNKIFRETEKITEVIVLTKIQPIDFTEIIVSVETTGNLVVVEEGSKTHGFGSEIIAGVIERIETLFKAKRVASL